MSLAAYGTVVDNGNVTFEEVAADRKDDKDYSGEDDINVLGNDEKYKLKDNDKEIFPTELKDDLDCNKNHVLCDKSRTNPTMIKNVLVWN